MDNLTLNQIEQATFVIIDTETTGKFPQLDRIVEIGAIRCRFFAESSDELQIKLVEPYETYSQLINPQVPLPAEVIRVHGIADDMLTAQPSFVEVCEDLEKFLGTSILVAHNAPFDVDFLEAEYRRCNALPRHRNVIDTVKLARLTWPNLDNHRLTTLAKLLKIDTGISHRALQDTEYCMKIFAACLEFFAKKKEGVTLKQLCSVGSSKPLSFGVQDVMISNQMALF